MDKSTRHTPWAFRIFVAIMFLIALGCGGNTTTSTSNGALGTLTLSSNGSTEEIAMVAEDTIQVFVNLVRVQGVNWPDAIRIALNDQVFEPVADISIPSNTTGDVLSLSFNLTAKSRTSVYDGSL